MDNHELPPGMRFYPTEEELFSFYLHHRLANSLPDIDRVIPVVDVYHFDPSQLPERSGIHNISDPEQWFFFCPRQEREALGGRPTRTTPSGYWKATGSSSLVYSTATRRVLGMKKTMVFYTGRAPTGTKTMWKMNEYKAVDVHDNTAGNATASSIAPRFRSDFTLCRVYIKTGTLRAFDRRPIVNLDQNEASTSNASQLQPPAETSLTYSVGSASSGDDSIDWSSFEDDLVNFPSLN